MEVSMENQHEHKTSQTKQADFWSNTEISELIKAMAVYFSDLDDFGKGVDINAILQKYRLYFEKKFTVNQILNAIHAHCERKTTIPKVADINAILNPEKPKITQAEFIHAREQHAAEKYPAHGYYGGIIKDYEAQEADARDVSHDGAMHPQLAKRLKKALLEGKDGSV